jgi:AraC-like DNA-binding protein
MQAHDHFALVLAKSPAEMVNAQGGSWIVGPDEVGVAYPGELYRLDAPRGAATLCVLLVDPAMLGDADRWRVRAEQRLPFRDPVVHDSELAARLHALFGDLRRGLTALDALDRLRETVSDLAVRHVGGDAVPPAACRVHPGAARAHAHLRAHVSEHVSLEDLVGVSRLSRFYLLRVFHKEFGVSPHEYQRHLRLARARRLLAAGVPASRVAYDVGFSDQSHLIRQFKPLTGLTPGAFAREWAGPGQARPAAAARARSRPTALA